MSAPKPQTVPAQPDCLHCNPAVPMPGDFEMDKAVLSCMMQAPDFAVDAAIQILGVSDFASEAGSLLFDVITRRHTAGEPVDPMSITAWFYDGRTEMLGKIGGPAFISEAYTASPNPSHVRHYAAQVLSTSKRRQMARIARALERAAILGTADDEDWRDTVMPLMRSADSILMDGKGQDIVHVKDVCFQYADLFEKGIETNLDPPISTGIEGVDKILDGGIRREYILIGGRQGHGKTLLTMQMAGKLAAEGRRGLVVGYEMSALQMVMRDIARETSVPLNQVMGRVAIEGQGPFRAIMRGISQIAGNWDVWFTESPYITLESVAAHARSLHRQKPLDFIIIDYLQLVPMKRAGKERSDEMLVAISYQAERIRKELGCTLIAPVQLNDDGLIRDARGILDAPQVFIRIEMEEVKNTDGEMESGDNGFLKFLKNRFGGSNRACPVFRNGPLQKFEDRAYERPRTTDNSTRRTRRGRD